MKYIALAALACASLGVAHGAVSTFEDVTLAPNSYWNGSPNGGANTFNSGGATFHNTFTDWGGGFTSWAGFASSNMTDATTAGFGNQYSSVTGGGSASATYGVGYSDGFNLPPAISFGGLVNLGMADITNTTYAALSMRDGDGFAKKFGGESGNDADFLLLTIAAYVNNVQTATLNFYLADFRFADNAQDYIVTNWTQVDLSGLGAADELRFTMTTSDVGEFGPNTPTYFAIDNLTTVPEPSAALLALFGMLPLLRRSRR